MCTNNLICTDAVVLYSPGLWRGAAQSCNLYVEARGGTAC